MRRRLHLKSCHRHCGPDRGPDREPDLGSPALDLAPSPSLAYVEISFRECPPLQLPDELVGDVANDAGPLSLPRGAVSGGGAIFFNFGTAVLRYYLLRSNTVHLGIRE